MGCLGYILLVFGTKWLISNEWIVRNTEMNIWLAVFLLVLLVGFADFLLVGIRFLVHFFTIPVAFLTVGIAWEVINWVFKYFSLWLVCYWTGWFNLPWIFGPNWLHALIIAFALTVLTRASSSSTNKK